MARQEQLVGSDGDSGADGERTKPANGEVPEAEQKRTLYERLGGNEGMTAIVEDFIPRVMADPRVNWERKGISTGGLFRRDRPVTWQPTPANIATLKEHMIQFLAVATGGPTTYGGKDMVSSHADMKITNAEFDAAVGDLKATLDRLRIPDQEQKELLAVVETTRPQVVTER